jgi:acyl carrier protein
MTLFDRVSTVLVDTFRVPPEQLTPATTLTELDLDSLDLVEFAMVVEEQLGVKITDTEAEGLGTLAEVVSLLEVKGAEPA